MRTLVSIAVDACASKPDAKQPTFARRRDLPASVRLLVEFTTTPTSTISAHLRDRRSAAAPFLTCCLSTASSAGVRAIWPAPVPPSLLASDLEISHASQLAHREPAYVLLLRLLGSWCSLRLARDPRRAFDELISHLSPFRAPVRMNDARSGGFGDRSSRVVVVGLVTRRSPERRGSLRTESARERRHYAVSEGNPSCSREPLLSHAASIAYVPEALRGEEPARREHPHADVDDCRRPRRSPTRTTVVTGQRRQQLQCCEPRLPPVSVLYEERTWAHDFVTASFAVVRLWWSRGDGAEGPLHLVTDDTLKCLVMKRETKWGVEAPPAKLGVATVVFHDERGTCGLGPRTAERRLRCGRGSSLPAALRPADARTGTDQSPHLGRGGAGHSRAPSPWPSGRNDRRATAPRDQEQPPCAVTVGRRLSFAPSDRVPELQELREPELEGPTRCRARAPIDAHGSTSRTTRARSRHDDARDAPVPTDRDSTREGAVLLRSDGFPPLAREKRAALAASTGLAGGLRRALPGRRSPHVFAGFRCAGGSPRVCQGLAGCG